jgi:Heavy metal binding domain
MFSKSKAFVVLLFVTLATIGACKNASSKPSETVTAPAAVEVKTDTSHIHVFSCPMHPEVTGKAGDKCPKCGMLLVHHD